MTGADPRMTHGGAAWARRGARCLSFHDQQPKIVALDILADPERTRDVTLLDG